MVDSGRLPNVGLTHTHDVCNANMH
jgi:hypothetical protein